MEGFFGLRPIVAVEGAAIGLGLVLWGGVTDAQAIFISLVYLVAYNAAKGGGV